MAFEPNPRLGKTVHGMDRILFGLKEANSQSFKEGQLVYSAGSSATGAITACASDSVIPLGIAQKDATNVSSGNIEIPIEAIYPGDEIIIKCTASGTDKLSNLFYPGTAYGLYVASNVCYADYDDTSNDIFVFIEPILTAAGNATYWGKFNIKCSGVGTGI